MSEQNKWSNTCGENMKVALAQMEVVPNQPGKNLEAMLAMIEQAKREGVDLIAFPELSISGYLLGDIFYREDLLREFMCFNEELRKASNGIAIAYGNVMVDTEAEINAWTGVNGPHPNKDGRSRKYNAVYVFQNGKPAERLRQVKALPDGIEPKHLLPDYRFFDDERYFFSLGGIAKDFGMTLEEIAQPFLIEVGGQTVPVGFEVCEDLWVAEYRRNGEAENVTNILINNGAQMIVNVSSSPWTFGKNSTRDRRIKFLAEESGDSFVPFIYVNRTGADNNGKNIITFDGGSTAYDLKGRPIKLSAAPYKAELLIVEDADFRQPPVERVEKPRIAQKYDAIIEGIRHVKNMTGAAEQPMYVIGLSGGIDSAVVAALLVQAVGADKVLAVNMPTRFNSDKTKDAAAQIAASLGIGYVQIPIDDLVNANIALIDKFDLDGSSRKLGESDYAENVAAKIRGTAILSNLAGKYGALFTNNGNKTEVALGYATLYGDVDGAIAPIADLTKREVFELAGYLNREVFRSEVIPEKLIPDGLFRFRDDQIPSGPELKDKQTSQIKLGYHCALVEAMTAYMIKTPEDIIQWYLDGAMEENLGISTALIKRWGMNDPEAFVNDLEWVVNRIQGNVFKRVQAPPLIVTSPTAFGYDRRESIVSNLTTRRYTALREQVLRMERYTVAEAIAA